MCELALFFLGSISRVQTELPLVTAEEGRSPWLCSVPFKGPVPGLRYYQSGLMTETVCSGFVYTPVGSEGLCDCPGSTRTPHGPVPLRTQFSGASRNLQCAYC